MHAISSHRAANRPINKHTNPQTNKQDRLQYTASLSLAHSVHFDITDTLIVRFTLLYYRLYVYT